MFFTGRKESGIRNHEKERKEKVSLARVDGSRENNEQKKKAIQKGNPNVGKEKNKRMPPITILLRPLMTRPGEK